MYLAQVTDRGSIRYVIRESYARGPAYPYRDLADLGPDPGRHIVYPGGNAYYVNDTVVDQFRHRAVRVDQDDLEALFWPFLRPDIKRKVRHFRDRSRNQSKHPVLGKEEIESIRTGVSGFDKRRQHYLRFGEVDQGSTARMPAVLFRELTAKSRDEIEQYFMRQERMLKASEAKTYVYVAFELQRHFKSHLARKMPQVLDQNRIDDLFLDEICGLNRRLFAEDTTDRRADLHDYLVRYLIMFFDNEYAPSSLLDEYVFDFTARHRGGRYRNRSGPDMPIRLDRANRIFGIGKQEAGRLSRKQITQRFRRLAKQHHPDKGGTNEAFSDLISAYHRLLSTLL